MILQYSFDVTYLPPKTFEDFTASESIHLVFFPNILQLPLNSGSENNWTFKQPQTFKNILFFNLH